MFTSHTNWNLQFSLQNNALSTNSKTFHNVNSLVKIRINTFSYIVTLLIRLKIRKNTKFIIYKYQHRNRKSLQYTLYSPITDMHLYMQLQYWGPIKEVSRPTVGSAWITHACCYFHGHAVVRSNKRGYITKLYFKPLSINKQKRVGWLTPSWHRPLKQHSREKRSGLPLHTENICTYFGTARDILVVLDVQQKIRCNIKDFGLQVSFCSGYILRHMTIRF